MAYPLYIDISKDPRNSVVINADFVQSTAFNSPVIGDTIPLMVQLLNGTTIADENTNGAIKVVIGNPGGTIYAYSDNFVVSESFWTGSINTSTAELASALGTDEYINTYLEVELTNTLTDERRSVCQLPIYVYNAVYSGSYALTLLPQYLSLSESDARYVRQGVAPSGSYWIQTGNYLHLSEDTWSVGIGTTTPSEQLQTTGNALFGGTVKSLNYFTGSFRGALTGTASNATYAVYAETASRASYATIANSAAVSSMSLYANSANSADFASASVEADTASYARYAIASRNAQYATSSISAGSSVTASYAITTSFAQSSRTSTTASYALTASYSLVSNITSSTLFVSSASYASSSISSSYSLRTTRYDINVMDYGAVGDNSTDNWTAFSASIVAASKPYVAGTLETYPNTVHIPPGKYVFTKPLTISGRTKLVGYGEKTVLIYYPATSSNSTAGININNCDTVELHNLTLQKGGVGIGITGVSINPSGSAGGVTHYAFNNVIFRYFNGCGVKSDNSYYGQFNNCRFESITDLNSISNGASTTPAIAFSGSNAQNEIQFNFCNFHRNDIDLSISNGYAVGVFNSSFEQTGKYNTFATQADCLYFKNINGISLYGNYIEANECDTGYAAVTFDACNNALIDGGIFSSEFGGVKYSDSLIRCKNINKNTSIRNVYLSEPNTYFIAVDTGSYTVHADKCYFYKGSELTSWSNISTYVSGANKVALNGSTFDEIMSSFNVVYSNDDTNPFFKITRGSGGQEWQMHNNNNTFTFRDGTRSKDVAIIKPVTTTTGSVLDVLTLQGQASTAVTTGFGSGIRIKATRGNDAAVVDTGRLNWVWTDATSGVEDSKLDICLTRNATNEVKTTIDSLGNISTSGSVTAVGVCNLTASIANSALSANTASVAVTAITANSASFFCTGSANYIPKWNGSNKLTATSLIIDNGTNICIGTGSSPGILTVRRAGGSGALSLNINNDLSAFGRDATFTLIPDSVSGVGGYLFKTYNSANVDTLALNSNGNVGIGITGSLSNKLHVQGSISASSVTASLLGTASNSVTASYVASVGGISNVITNNTDNNVLTATGGGTINGEDNLTYSGGVLSIGSTSNPTLRFLSGSTPTGLIRINTTDDYFELGDLYSADPKYGVKVFTNDTARLTISSSGNVGIGTTTPTNAKLEVNGNVYANSFTGSLLGTASDSALLNGLSGSYFTNATNINAGTLDVSRLPYTPLNGTTLTYNAPTVWALTFTNAKLTASITQASSVNDGYLSSTDWNTFNNKQAALVTGNTYNITASWAANTNVTSASYATKANSVNPNSVTLGTDTTGNYVADLTANAGLVVLGGTGENTHNTISLDSQISVTGITGSLKGGADTATLAYNALLANHADTSTTASNAVLATSALTATSATTANSATSASYATNASNAVSASWAPGGGSGPGTGTVNHMAKWATTSTLSSTSNIQDDGTTISIGGAGKTTEISGALKLNVQIDGNSRSATGNYLTINYGGTDYYIPLYS